MVEMESSGELRQRFEPKGDTEKDDVKRFTANDVASHNRPEDCWLIIRGKVYDVSAWVSKHPGGSLIYVRAGYDCTQLFESYHPVYVRKLLGKYFIGDLERNDESVGTSVLEYAEEDGDKDFYTTLKRRVEVFFKEKNINPRVHPHMFIKSFIILAGFFSCYYAAFFACKSLLLSFLFASVMGFLLAEVGMSIQHDCNHGAYGNNRTLAYILGASLDLVGSSSFMWKQQHVVGHHMNTNVDNFDPDIRVKDPDFRRVTVQQPVQWYHAYQHVYLGALYGLLALKSVFLDDFNAFFSGYIGPVKVAKMTTLESAIFWGGKLVYSFYMFVLPSIWGIHSTGTFAFLYIVSQLVGGWTLALLFQVAHVVEEADFPTADCSEGTPKIAKGWAATQVATTTDFSPNSFFWMHISGGLNYQIEHHLFPGVCHVHYPSLKPIVEAVCKEFGVPYHCYPSFFSALKAHFGYLKKVGASGFDFRLSG